MGSLIEELQLREAEARAEADRLRVRIEELSEELGTRVAPVVAVGPLARRRAATAGAHGRCRGPGPPPIPVGTQPRSADVDGRGRAPGGGRYNARMSFPGHRRHCR